MLSDFNAKCWSKTKQMPVRWQLVREFTETLFRSKENEHPEKAGSYVSTADAGQGAEDG